MTKITKIKKKGLGSGLSSLLGQETNSGSNLIKQNIDNNYKMIPIEFITPGPWQPTKNIR